MSTNDELNVLIVSASIGTGHTQAAKAVEEYWTAKNPHACITHIDFLESDTLSFDNILKETYIKMIDVFPMLYDLVYRLSQGEHKGGLAQTVLSWLLKSRMLKLINKLKPDVIVFTHPFPCGAACILKRQNLIQVPLVAVITDFTTHQFWIYPQVDRYFVATEKMVGELEHCGIDRRRVRLTGIPVRRNFFKYARTTTAPVLPATLLVMGGGLGLGSLENALARLDDLPGVEHIMVVSGQNTSLYEALIEMKRHMHTPTTVYGYTTDIPELMQKATLLITKPGALTCMEAVTIGTPMVFFNAIPGQEEANALLLEQRGCARWARDIHNLEDVVTALLTNPMRLQQMAEATLQWRVDGAAHIVREIEELLRADCPTRLSSLKKVNI